MSKVIPFLMFPHGAEEAVAFYLSLFPGKLLQTTYFSAEEIEFLSFLPPEQRPGPAGQVSSLHFELLGQEYFACNGGGYFQLTEAAGLTVICNDQAELDFYWQALSAGGATSQCGWLKDRFGLSWQVLPEQLSRWMADPVRSVRVSLAMLQMTKIEIATLEQAYRG